jgi:hypothetical protein
VLVLEISQYSAIEHRSVLSPKLQRLIPERASLKVKLCVRNKAYFKTSFHPMRVAGTSTSSLFSWRRYRARTP